MRRRPDRSVPGYRGAAGIAEEFFVATLDRDNRIISRLSPAFATRHEAVAAWLRLRSRHGRLVRVITLLSVEG